MEITVILALSNLFLIMIFPCPSLHCKLVPAQYMYFKNTNTVSYSDSLFVFLHSILQYHKYRKSFKEVLHQERVLDEARKREAMHATRLNRLQKQVQNIDNLFVRNFIKIYLLTHRPLDPPPVLNTAEYTIM